MPSVVIALSRIPVPGTDPISIDKSCYTTPGESAPIFLDREPPAMGRTRIFVPLFSNRRAEAEAARQQKAERHRTTGPWYKSRMWLGSE